MFDGPFSISTILGLSGSSKPDTGLGPQFKLKSSDGSSRSYKIPYGGLHHQHKPSSGGPTKTSSDLKKKSTAGSVEEKKAKRFRSSFSTDQLRLMEDTFRHRPYLSTAQVEELAGNLQLSNRQVKIWFQNRRTKLKKQVTPAAGEKYGNPTISQYLYYIQSSNNNIISTLNRYSDRRY